MNFFQLVCILVCVYTHTHILEFFLTGLFCLHCDQFTNNNIYTHTYYCQSHNN